MEKQALFERIIVNSLPLYTLNTADFDFIKGIELYTP